MAGVSDWAGFSTPVAACSCDLGPYSAPCWSSWSLAATATCCFSSSNAAKRSSYFSSVSAALDMTLAKIASTLKCDCGFGGPAFWASLMPPAVAFGTHVFGEFGDECALEDLAFIWSSTILKLPHCPLVSLYSKCQPSKHLPITLLHLHLTVGTYQIF